MPLSTGARATDVATPTRSPSHRVLLRPRSVRLVVVDGAAAGLWVAGEFVPFPGAGLECELGLAVPASEGDVEPVLQDVLERRGGIPASKASSGRVAPDSVARDGQRRVFSTRGASYLDHGHLELNTFYRLAARDARGDLDALLDDAATWLETVHPDAFFHATGDDGWGSTWSSLHVNTAVSWLSYDRLVRTQRAHEVALGYYLPAQLTLAAVDGNLGIGDRGLLVSDRIAAFDQVYGMTTMRPSRAMIVDRDEPFGVARIMHMARALAFGEASVLGLVATQIDTLIVELCVHGVLEVPLEPLSDPIGAAREFARLSRVRETASVQIRLNDTRRRFLDLLDRELGSSGVEQIVPEARAAVERIEKTLRAVLRDDQDECVRQCDWARRREFLAGCLGGQRDHARVRDELLLLNAAYARAGSEQLRAAFPGAGPIERDPGREEPTETSSWLLYEVCRRSAGNPRFADQMREVDVSWRGLSSGAGESDRRIELVPYVHTQRRVGPLVSGATTPEELFDRLAIGERSDVERTAVDRRLGAGVDVPIGRGTDLCTTEEPHR